MLGWLLHHFAMLLIPDVQKKYFLSYLKPFFHEILQVHVDQV